MDCSKVKYVKNYSNKSLIIGEVYELCNENDLKSWGLNYVYHYSKKYFVNLTLGNVIPCTKDGTPL